MFDFEMKADASKALAASDSIINSLAEIERRSRSSGSSMTSAWGASAAASNPLATNFAKIADQLQRQEDMVRRIHAPMLEMNADFRALQAINAQGLITAQQYAEELKRIANAPPPKPSPVAGVGKDVLGAVAGGLGIGLSVGALATQAVSAISDEIDAWREKQEAIRNATNTLVKYYDNSEQAERALVAQRDLARDLHVSLGEAVNAYDAVRQATDGLYLSSGQQVAITKSLGEVMIMNNRPVGDAAQIMQKLQYAMTIGTMSSKDLIAITKEFPDVAATWAAAVGKNGKELISMADHGKVGTDEIRKFAQSLESSDPIHAQFAKRVKTNEQVLAEQGQKMRELFDVNYAMQKNVDAVNDLWERQTLMLQRAHDEALKYKTGLQDVGSVITGLSTSLQKLNTLLNDPWSQGPGEFSRTVKAAIDITDPVVKAKAQLRDLDAGWKVVTDHSKPYYEQYRKTREALVSTITGMAIPVNYYKQELEAIRQPERDWQGRQAALSALLHDNTITVLQYNQALQKARETYMSSWAKKPNPNEMNAEDLEKWRDAGKDYKEVSVSDMKPPEFGKSMDQLLESGKDSIQKLNEKMKEALKEQEKLINQVGKAAEDALVGGVGSLSDALVDGASGADVAWGDFFSNFMEDIEKAILKALILQAIGSSTGGPAGAGSGLLGYLFGGAHASGGSFTAQGTGGTDSVPVLFRMSPGERADFTPSGKPRGGDAGGSGSGATPIVMPAPTVHVHTDDRRALQRAIESPEGDAALAAWARRNKHLLRGVTQ